MIFELHCHTHYSKGTKIPTEVMMSPKEVVRLARKNGIDGLAITDHKVTGAWKEARQEAKKQGIMLIPGMEVESSDGHILGLGLSEAVPNRLTAEETMERIREQGGFVVAPHPYDIKNDGIKDKCLEADAVEVFNSFGMDRIANWYTRRKADKAGRPMVVGSDVHMPEMMGLSVNVAEARSMDELFSEIRKGRVGFRTQCVSAGPVVGWARDRMVSSYDDVVRYIERNYGEPKKWLSRTLLDRFVHSESCVWNALGSFSITCAVAYSGLKLFTY